MSSAKILEKLNENKKSVNIAGVIFNVEPNNEDVQVGLPFSEILKLMKKLPKGELFKRPENVFYK